MPTFYDLAGNPVQIDDPKEARRAYLAGEIGTAPGQKVPVIGADKTVQQVEGPSLGAALATGQIESPFDTRVRESAAKLSGWDVGVRKFGSEMFFGIPEQILEKRGSEEARAVAERAKEEHPISNILGGVLGFGANIAATWDVGALTKLGRTAETAEVAAKLPIRAKAAAVLPEEFVQGLGKPSEVISNLGKKGVSEAAAPVAEAVKEAPAARRFFQYVTPHETPNHPGGYSEYFYEDARTAKKWDPHLASSDELEYIASHPEEAESGYRKGLTRTGLLKEVSREDYLAGQVMESPLGTLKPGEKFYQPPLEDVEAAEAAPREFATEGSLALKPGARREVVPAYVPGTEPSPQKLLETVKEISKLPEPTNLGGVTREIYDPVTKSWKIKQLGAQLAARGVEGIAQAARVVEKSAQSASKLIEGAEAAAAAIKPKPLSWSEYIGNSAKIAAAYTAPSAIVDVILGDPDSAAEKMAMAVGMGGIIGAGAGAIGKLGRPIAELAASKLDRLPTEVLAKGADDATKAAIEGIGSDKIAQTARELGLLPKFGENLETRAQRWAQARDILSDQVQTKLGAETPIPDYPAIHQRIIDAVSNVGRAPLTKEAAATARLENLARPPEVEKILRELDVQMQMGGHPTIGNLVQGLKTLNASRFEPGVGDSVSAAQQAIITELERISQGNPEATALIGKLNRVRAGADATLSAAKQKGIHQQKSISDFIPMIARTVLGGVAGSMIGGVLGEGEHRAGGGAMGALYGMIGHGGGSKWITELLAKQGPELIAAYGDKIGLTVAAHALAEGRSGLEKIPTILAAATREIPSDHFIHGSRILGQLSHTSATEGQGDTTTAISKALSDQRIATHNTGLAAVLDRGAPTVTAAYSKHLQNKIDYIKEALPKSFQGNPLQPFQSDMGKEHPISNSEKKRAGDKLDIVWDPMRVIQHLRYGTLTKDHVDALNRVWPFVGQQIKDKVTEFGLSEEGKKSSYAVRLNASLLCGQSFDPALTRVAQYQANYAQPQPPPKTGGKPLQLSAAKLSSEQRVKYGQPA